jgi:hypothetical protein
MHPALDQITADRYDGNDAGHRRQQLQCTFLSNDRNDSDD